MSRFPVYDSILKSEQSISGLFSHLDSNVVGIIFDKCPEKDLCSLILTCKGMLKLVLTWAIKHYPLHTHVYQKSNFQKWIWKQIAPGQCQFIQVRINYDLYTVSLKNPETISIPSDRVLNIHAFTPSSFIHCKHIFTKFRHVVIVKVMLWNDIGASTKAFSTLDCANIRTLEFGEYSVYNLFDLKFPSVTHLTSWSNGHLMGIVGLFAKTFPKLKHLKTNTTRIDSDILFESITIVKPFGYNLESFHSNEKLKTKKLILEDITIPKFSFSNFKFIGTIVVNNCHIEFIDDGGCEINHYLYTEDINLDFLKFGGSKAIIQNPVSEMEKSTFGTVALGTLIDSEFKTIKIVNETGKIIQPTLNGIFSHKIPDGFKLSLTQNDEFRFPNDGYCFQQTEAFKNGNIWINTCYLTTVYSNKPIQITECETWSPRKPFHFWKFNSRTHFLKNNSLPKSKTYHAQCFNVVKQFSSSYQVENSQMIGIIPRFNKVEMAIYCTYMIAHGYLDLFSLVEQIVPKTVWHLFHDIAEKFENQLINVNTPPNVLFIICTTDKIQIKQ